MWSCGMSSTTGLSLFPDHSEEVVGQEEEVGQEWVVVQVIGQYKPCSQVMDIWQATWVKCYKLGLSIEKPSLSI